MPRTLTCSLTLLAVLAPASAIAGAAEQVADDLDNTLAYLPALRVSPADRLYGGEGNAAECRKAIATGRKAGLKDSDRIYAFRFRELEDEVHFDDEREPYLELRELGPLCDEYELLQKMVPAAGLMQEILQTLEAYRTIDPIDLGADMGQQLMAQGETCLAATDKAIAAGAPADRKSRIGTLELTLTEGKTQVCQLMIDYGVKAAGDIKAAHQAEFDRIAAKYKKAGIKGARLELFVESDNGDWLTKGCATLRDIKKLAKAKKLHQWWEAPDGSVTIRTYTFKGNKVKSIKNKVYRDADAAYARGCK